MGRTVSCGSVGDGIDPTCHQAEAHTTRRTGDGFHTEEGSNHKDTRIRRRQTVHCTTCWTLTSVKEPQIVWQAAEVVSKRQASKSNNLQTLNHLNIFVNI